MGMMDKLRGLFSGSNNTQTIQEDRNAKSSLVDQILDLANKINRINCFDGSIRGLTSVSSQNSLLGKDMQELEQLYAKLSNTYDGLVQQKQKYNEKTEATIAAKWTGEKTNNMTNHDLDFSQRGD